MKSIDFGKEEWEVPQEEGAQPGCTGRPPSAWRTGALVAAGLCGRKHGLTEENPIQSAGGGRGDGSMLRCYS
jgi:hypothetical protein